MVSQFHAHAKSILGSSFYAKTFSGTYIYALATPILLIMFRTIYLSTNFKQTILSSSCHQHYFCLKNDVCKNLPRSWSISIQRAIREVGVSSLNKSRGAMVAPTYRTNQGQT